MLENEIFYKAPASLPEESRQLGAGEVCERCLAIQSHERRRISFANMKA